jgi:hypothetical protein
MFAKFLEFSIHALHSRVKIVVKSTSRAMMSRMEVEMPGFIDEDDTISCLQSVSSPLEVKLKAVTACLQPDDGKGAQISGRLAGTIFHFTTNLLIRSADYFIKHDKLGKAKDISEETNAEAVGNKSMPAFMNPSLWQILTQLVQLDLTEISVGVATVSLHFLKPVSCLCMQFLADENCSDFKVLSSNMLQSLRLLRIKFCGVAGGGSWQPPMQSLASITGKLILRYIQVTAALLRSANHCGESWTAGSSRAQSTQRRRTSQPHGHNSRDD